MPDPSLHGNGEDCPACALRREADRDRTVYGSARLDCNNCHGTGRIAYTVRQVYEIQLAEARKHYWSQKQYA
ncbi:hypothetical protein RA27_02115 [Ruegeria sp. ANG-R]|uniref:hypothetical protein n=1 Tax=Ruegeria sp. ANG-R TaxID=1577903 RepID=UPI000580176F|nr:hypothetical protein [Ruegeria sp. ANG-R]KIC42213.1 hypothetical protein RA27_02115 [Ruegeria sp. ANG-R]